MAIDRMTLDEYLANYSEKRRLDKVIKSWFVSNNGAKYYIKSKKEWDKEIKDFYSMTEKK